MVYMRVKCGRNVLKTGRYDYALSTLFSFHLRTESSKCPARAVIAKSRARHMLFCHSIYFQVVKVHLFNIGLPMNRYTFFLPSVCSENQNAFGLLSICANAVYNVIQSLEDISSIRFFAKIYTKL